MAKVAKFDDGGVLVDVVTVPANEAITDPVARTLAVSDQTDLHQHLGKMRVDWQAGCVRPVEAFEHTEDNEPSAAELVARALEDLHAQLSIEPGRNMMALVSRVRR